LLWSLAFAGSNEAGQQPDWEKERQWQCSLLRCIVGNPFAPLLDRNFPGHVPGIARTITATFPAVAQDYSILADALEEESEDQAAAHCRQPEHAEGCHVLEWIEQSQRPKRRRRSTRPDARP